MTRTFEVVVPDDPAVAPTVYETTVPSPPPTSVPVPPTSVPVPPTSVPLPSENPVVFNTGATAATGSPEVVPAPVEEAPPVQPPPAPAAAGVDTPATSQEVSGGQPPVEEPIQQSVRDGGTDAANC